jgi:hypothetical protein
MILTVSTDAVTINLDKLRACLRTVRDQDLFSRLDNALERLSPRDLEQVVRPYVQLEQIRQDGLAVEEVGLLARVRAFAEATCTGEYYEPFDVNSKTYTKLSRGTLAWISTFLRLLDRCVAAAGKVDRSEVLEAMSILFDLLEQLDRCGEEVLFFADEGGSWLVGVDWKQVLAAWLRVLAEATNPERFAAAVLERHRRLPSYERRGLLVLARELATPIQAAALAMRLAAVPPTGGGDP